MRFSIIVPIYQAGDELEACLSSLEKQSFRDFEVILADGGSTDGPAAIAERYAQADSARFQLLRLENRGLGGARNACMDRAKGEYWFFPDGGDYILPETLEIADEYLRRYGDDVLVTGFRRVLPGDEAEIRVERRLIAYEPWTPERCLLSCGGPRPFFIRGEICRRNKLRWPEKLWCGDRALLPLFSIRCGGIGKIDARLCQYIQRQDSVMGSRDTGRMMESIDGCEFFLEQYRKAGQFERFYEALEYRVCAELLFDQVPRLFAAGRELEKAEASWRYVKERFPDFRTNPRLLKRVDRNLREQLMLEGRLEELWETFYTPPLEQARRFLAEHPDRSLRPETPLLSLIIPIYNVAEYLTGCMASVLSATEGIEAEILLVNDGSTDESGAIAALFAERYAAMRLLEQENRGISAARNAGAARARGKYIAFVDSDDQVLPNMYRDLLRTAEEHGAELVNCAAEQGYERETELWRPELHARAYGAELPGPLSDADLVRKIAWDPYVWNKLLRRDFYERSAFAFPEGKIFEDNRVSVLFYGLARRPCVIQEPGYFYRKRRGDNPSLVQGKKDVTLPALLAMIEDVIRITAERLDGDTLQAVKDRFLQQDLRAALTNLYQLDHPDVFLETLRACLKRCFTEADLARQNAVLQAEIRAVLEDDLDRFTRIRAYEKTGYRKAQVLREDGRPLRLLPAELLGREKEPAASPTAPSPLRAAINSIKKSGESCRLRAALAFAWTPAAEMEDWELRLCLVSAVSGQTLPLEISDRKKNAFAFDLTREQARWAMDRGESVLLRVEAETADGPRAAYLTSPVNEVLFRREGGALRLQRRSDGRARLEACREPEPPLVSVAVPVYNAAGTLPRCMRALLEQTHSRLEILLVDDGSQDGSGALCDAYAARDARVKAFHLEHGGVARARNLALDRYSGDYLMFADADDLVSRDIVERLLEVLRRSGQHVAACIAKDMRNRETEDHACAARKATKLWRWGEIDYLDRLSHRVVWGALYDREALEDLRFDEQYEAGADTLFFAQLAQKLRRYAQVDEPHYCHVQHPNSVGRGGFSRRMVDDLLVWERVQAMTAPGSRSCESATEVLLGKIGKTLALAKKDPGCDPELFRELCRIARRHRQDPGPEQDSRKRLKRRLMTALPGLYAFAVNEKAKLWEKRKGRK